MPLCIQIYIFTQKKSRTPTSKQVDDDHASNQANMMTVLHATLYYRFCEVSITDYNFDRETIRKEMTSNFSDSENIDILKSLFVINTSFSPLGRWVKKLVPEEVDFLARWQ